MDTNNPITGEPVAQDPRIVVSLQDTPEGKQVVLEMSDDLSETTALQMLSRASVAVVTKLEQRVAAAAQDAAVAGELDRNVRANGQAQPKPRGARLFLPRRFAQGGN